MQTSGCRQVGAGRWLQAEGVQAGGCREAGAGRVAGRLVKFRCHPQLIKGKHNASRKILVVKRKAAGNIIFNF